MTIPDQYSATGPHPEAASQEAAHIRAMRGEHAPGFDANYILEARCVRLNSENIELRTRLDLMRKSKEAAQELLEAERQKNAALNDKLINAEDARTANARSALENIGRARELRLLRTNDAATIADLERRLREAEGQLKAQRLPAANVGGITGNTFHPWIAEAAKLKELTAENEELRRTIRLISGTACEYLNLITELAADPADEKRKEAKP